MLAFARREELRATEVDPTELLRNLRAILANAIGPVVRVAVDAPTALPALRVDRAQLETTLINLAVNARDAMPDGGTVTLGRRGRGGGRRSRAAVRRATGQPGAAGSTSGSGSPIPASAWTPPSLTRAVEPFFTTKPRDKGTGLGLSMADGFAAQSGGTLRIDSAPGRGTTVSLWLPCAVEPRVPDAGTAGRPRPGADRRRPADDAALPGRMPGPRGLGGAGGRGWRPGAGLSGCRQALRPADFRPEHAGHGWHRADPDRPAAAARPGRRAAHRHRADGRPRAACRAERLCPAAQAGLPVRTRRLPGRPHRPGAVGPGFSMRTRMLLAAPMPRPELRPRRRNVL